MCFILRSGFRGIPVIGNFIIPVLEAGALPISRLTRSFLLVYIQETSGVRETIWEICLAVT